MCHKKLLLRWFTRQGLTNSVTVYLERGIHVRKQCQRLQDRLLMSAYVTYEMNFGLTCEKVLAQLVSCMFITRSQPCFSHSSAAISRPFVGNINLSLSQRLDGQSDFTRPVEPCGFHMKDVSRPSHLAASRWQYWLHNTSARGAQISASTTLFLSFSGWLCSLCWYSGRNVGHCRSLL